MTWWRSLVRAQSESSQTFEKYFSEVFLYVKKAKARLFIRNVRFFQYAFIGRNGLFVCCLPETVGARLINRRPCFCIIFIRHFHIVRMDEINPTFRLNRIVPMNDFFFPVLTIYVAMSSPSFFSSIRPSVKRLKLPIYRMKRPVYTTNNALMTRNVSVYI